MIGATVEFNWYDLTNKTNCKQNKHIDLTYFQGQTIDQLRNFIHDDFYKQYGSYNSNVYKLESKLIEVW